jgi:hypothetical protein
VCGCRPPPHFGENQGHGIEEVVGAQVGGRVVLTVAARQPGLEQDGAQAGITAGLNVGRGVADEVRRATVGIKPISV